MDLLNLFSILITLCALFSYLNCRYLHFPTTIGLLLISLVVSLTLIAMGAVSEELTYRATQAIRGVNFNMMLMQVMLGFLLFAGAQHVDLDRLTERKWLVSILATIGVFFCTGLLGGCIFFLFKWMGMDIPLPYCLLFGALISPTDPVAVLGILRQVNAPQEIESTVAGESLFNDGIGVVVFIVLLDVATFAHELSVSRVLSVFLLEAVGGVLYGLLIGYLAYRLLKSVDNYQVEVLITLALVMGGYSLASFLHTSGPLAMVVAGLLIGNRGRVFAMSDTTREHLDTFWELLDEVLNAFLFVMIGFELLVLKLEVSYLIAGFLAIPAVILSRFISVGLPISILRMRRSYSPHLIKVVTWGGLRGGISVALALSLPIGPHREVLIVVTFIVVTFSIIVQGLSFGPLLKKLFGTPQTA